MVQRAFDALRPGGQVLLADYFADEQRKLKPFGVRMGLTMLANIDARTHVHATRRRSAGCTTAGFERVRMIEPIGFNYVYVASQTTREGMTMSKTHPSPSTC